MNAHKYTYINTYIHVLTPVHIECLFIINLSKSHNNKHSGFRWYLKFSYPCFWKLIFSGMWRFTACPDLVVFEARLPKSSPWRKEIFIKPHYVYMSVVRLCFELSCFEIPDDTHWCRVCFYHFERTVAGSYRTKSINVPTECQLL